MTHPKQTFQGLLDGFNRMWRRHMQTHAAQGSLGGICGPLGGQCAFEKVALWRDDGVRRHNDEAPKDLVFIGRRILGAMDDCTDTRVRGTSYAGEIVSTVAIYKAYEPNAAGYVAAQCRFNLRPILINPKNPPPFLEIGREFETLAEAIAWIEAGPLITEGKLRTLFAEAVRRHSSDQRRPRFRWSA